MYKAPNDRCISLLPVVAGGLIIALSFVFGIEAFKEEGTPAAALDDYRWWFCIRTDDSCSCWFIAFWLLTVLVWPWSNRRWRGWFNRRRLPRWYRGGFHCGLLAKFIADKVQLPCNQWKRLLILTIPFIASLFTGLVMVFYDRRWSCFWRNERNDRTLNNMGTSNARYSSGDQQWCASTLVVRKQSRFTHSVLVYWLRKLRTNGSYHGSRYVPALGMGLATFLVKDKFEAGEREAEASFVLGLPCFISRRWFHSQRKTQCVLSRHVCSGAPTGALSMMFGAQLMARHTAVYIRTTDSRRYLSSTYVPSSDCSRPAVTGFLVTPVPVRRWATHVTTQSLSLGSV